MDGRGIPLALVVTGANCNDVTQVDAVLKQKVLLTSELHQSSVAMPMLYADAGYRGQRAEESMRAHGYEPHVESRQTEKEKKQKSPEFRAQRWVVESCHSWLNRFRKIHVRYEKTLVGFTGLCQLAAAIITFRRVAEIYGPY